MSVFSRRIHHTHKGTQTARYHPSNKLLDFDSLHISLEVSSNFRLVKAVLSFIILFVQHGPVPFPPPCHPLSKKTMLTAAMSFHCIKYCALVTVITKNCPSFGGVIDCCDTRPTTSFPQLVSGRECVGHYTNQHMALSYMNGCQQGQMWETHSRAVRPSARS